MIMGDKQHAIHASKIMHMERTDLQVGPISIEIVEPLEKLRIKIKDLDNDIDVDMLFTGRSAPIEEPRFQYRRGPRMLFDYTRLTQNGSWEGTLSVKGESHTIQPSSFSGTRDRSWGVRPVGTPDPQPMAPAEEPQFYWVWVPLNFEDRSTFYHINADGDGKPWNESGAVMMNGSSEKQMMASAKSALTFKKGTRHATDVTVEMIDEEGGASKIDIKIQKNFYMKGMGYMHPEWGHGVFKGELETFYECYDLTTLDETELENLHVQALATATLTLPNGETREGRGIVEQLIFGRHDPSGLKDLLDGAS